MLLFSQTFPHDFYPAVHGLPQSLRSGGPWIAVCGAILQEHSRQICRNYVQGGRQFPLPFTHQLSLRAKRSNPVVYGLPRSLCSLSHFHKIKDFGKCCIRSSCKTLRVLRSTIIAMTVLSLRAKRSNPVVYGLPRCPEGAYTKTPAGGIPGRRSSAVWRAIRCLLSSAILPAVQLSGFCG
jgi:hypothetical protein